MKAYGYKSEYDQKLSSTLISARANSQIELSVHSYNGSQPKVQLSRLNSHLIRGENGVIETTLRYEKLGRLSVDEIEAVATEMLRLAETIKNNRQPK